MHFYRPIPRGYKQYLSSYEKAVMSRLALLKRLFTLCAVIGVSAGVWAAPATLDTSFSGDGKFLSATGISSGVVTSAANYPGNKLVLAGQCETNAADKDFCVWRLNRNGSLDSSFSGNGSAIVNVNGTSDIANAVAVDQNGRIVLAGVCTPSGQRDFCLARLTPDGALDNSFDNNGRLSTEIDGDDEAVAVAIRRDGKILVAGTCKQGVNDSNFCVARYETDGALDTTFFSTGTRTFDMYGQNDNAAAVLSQTDNRVIVAGTCKETSSGNNRFCVARFYASGMPDDTFGTNGKRAVDVVATAVNSLTAAALQPDGKIVLAGTCLVSGIRLACAARLLPDGSDDASFGSSGKSILLNYADDVYVTSVAVQPDGKIVLGSYCNNGSNGFDFCWDRLNPDGSRDDTVGPAKPVTAIGTSADTAGAVIITPEGKVALAGNCRRSSGLISDACVARYEGGPLGYKNCKLDIDGDGIVNGTIDSLISSRIAAGMRTSAILNGINFPAGATRNSWAEIRDYLTHQCGVPMVP
jgi:uncharacterized delta-60 repeat protein